MLREEQEEGRNKNNPLTTQASTAVARSSCPPTCKQGSKDEGGKNWLTNDDRGAVILVVKLKRTDTTLDLSLYIALLVYALGKLWG